VLAVPAAVTGGAVSAGAVVAALLAGPLAGLAAGGDATAPRPRSTPSVASGLPPGGRADPARLRTEVARMQIEACWSSQLRAYQAGYPADPDACPPLPEPTLRAPRRNAAR